MVKLTWTEIKTRSNIPLGSPLMKSSPNFWSTILPLRPHGSSTGQDPSAYPRNMKKKSPLSGTSLDGKRLAFHWTLAASSGRERRLKRTFRLRPRTTRGTQHEPFYFNGPYTAINANRCLVFSLLRRITLRLSSILTKNLLYFPL